ncbi:hypothetical protein DFH08DRAFT_944288 [Mycena albidolilacea]|uniref:Uncharacterized protein n=1 Tax=Mycena albidolilacea TaxID=1033008 RepID=A0AAD6Z5R3_9AGAR|nr:hypothetical protein DFH08DRAFT_944288 [Mycena albidolilacea]
MGGCGSSFSIEDRERAAREGGGRQGAETNGSCASDALLRTFLDKRSTTDASSLFVPSLRMPWRAAATEYLPRAAARGQYSGRRTTGTGTDAEFEFLHIMLPPHEFYPFYSELPPPLLVRDQNLHVQVAHRRRIKSTKSKGLGSYNIRGTSRQSGRPRGQDASCAAAAALTDWILQQLIWCDASETGSSSGNKFVARKSSTGFE